jgi:hypothetical protein
MRKSVNGCKINTNRIFYFFIFLFFLVLPFLKVDKGGFTYPAPRLPPIHRGLAGKAFCAPREP